MELRRDIRFYLIFGCVLAVVLGVVAFMLSREHPLANILRAIALAGLLTAILITPICIHHHRYRREAVQPRLDWLLQQGFEIETVGEYWGYTGTYRGYFVRVYHEQDSPARHINGLNAGLCIMVYFMPPFRPNGSRDNVIWSRFQDDIGQRIFGLKRAFMSSISSSLDYTVPFTLSTRRMKIQAYMDGAVDKVIQHGFKPLEMEILDNLMKKDPLVHGPSTETYRRNFPSFL